ncbi:hypothetical protein ANRL4_01513 [Anaerolineae bacterium]|nr:hypothetical protein ANRL4_01513 [Anaerolineae bacterium]
MMDDNDTHPSTAASDEAKHIVAGVPIHQPTPTSEIQTRPLRIRFDPQTEEITLIDIPPEQGASTEDDEDTKILIDIPVESLPEDVEKARWHVPEPIIEPPPSPDVVDVYATTEIDLIKPTRPQLPDLRTLSGLQARVILLTEAIEKYPDAPANYVLRGEALIEAGDDQAAVDDFRNALKIIKGAVESQNWGYIYPMLAERARAGLRHLQSR